jgi:hypothetical protein
MNIHLIKRRTGDSSHTVQHQQYQASITHFTANHDNLSLRSRGLYLLCTVLSHVWSVGRNDGTTETQDEAEHRQRLITADRLQFIWQAPLKYRIFSLNTDVCC